MWVFLKLPAILFLWWFLFALYVMCFVRYITLYVMWTPIHAQTVLIVNTFFSFKNWSPGSLSECWTILFSFFFYVLLTKGFCFLIIFLSFSLMLVLCFIQSCWWQIFWITEYSSAWAYCYDNPGRLSQREMSQYCNTVLLSVNTQPISQSADRAISCSVYNHPAMHVSGSWKDHCRLWGMIN